MGKPKIIFEDSSILLLDKPADLVVNRVESVRRNTIQDWLEKRPSFRTLKPSSKRNADFIKRAGLIHRLDKETSGLLLVAKTPRAFENLQRQFKERQVEKRYLALVHGVVEPKEGIIQAAISRSPFRRKRFGVFLGGRKAETKYKVISLKSKIFRGEKKFYSLLEARPTTGRTHQIRVHLRHIGHPIVGDEKYSGRKTARTTRRWCPRQFLHASYLAFIHPETGKRVDFNSALARELRGTLDSLGLKGPKS